MAAKVEFANVIYLFADVLYRCAVELESELVALEILDSSAATNDVDKVNQAVTFGPCFACSTTVK
jgi:hypothetical protein